MHSRRSKPIRCNVMRYLAKINKCLAYLDMLYIAPQAVPTGKEDQYMKTLPEFHDMSVVNFVIYSTRTVTRHAGSHNGTKYCS